jgi:DNA-binding NtrC family response regulator
MQTEARILIVDDEKIALKNLEHVMKKEGISLSPRKADKCAQIAGEQSFEVVLTDLRMKVDGCRYSKIHELYLTQVIMITGFAAETTVETMKHGAFYYIETLQAR